MHKVRRRKKQDLDENHNRWLVSYADFLTLLFAFFVVMYSISSINEGKYRVLSDSISSAFRAEMKGRSVRSGQSIKSPINEKIILPITGLPLISQNYSNREIAKNKLYLNSRQNLQIILNEVSQIFSSQIKYKTIHITKNRLFLDIEIQSDILFSSGSVKPSARAKRAVKRLSTLLKKYNNKIQVEGFTDNVSIKSNAYPSNWELSAARAASIVRLFAENGILPRRLSAIGYGEYRPVAKNDTEMGRRKNRRVDIVILSNQNINKIGTNGISEQILPVLENKPPTNILAPFVQDK
jgi:chemotaxis protein MotB